MKYLGVIILIVGYFFIGAVAHAEEPNTQTQSSFQLTFPQFLDQNSDQYANTPGTLVGRLYTYALGLSGTLAVIMIVYGGVKYVASGGSVAARSDALDIIKNAVWGIVLLGGAYLILNTINPDLTRLSSPTLEPIQPPTDDTQQGTPGTWYDNPSLEMAGHRNNLHIM